MNAARNHWKSAENWRQPLKITKTYKNTHTEPNEKCGIVPNIIENVENYYNNIQEW